LLVSVKLNSPAGGDYELGYRPEATEVSHDYPPIITPEEWAQYVDLVSEARITKLCRWRGFKRSTCNLFKDHKEVAVFKGYWAFPNRDLDGDIRSIHYRVPPKAAGAKAAWYYAPKGAKVHALVWGDLSRAARIVIVESQWCAMSFVDELSLDPFVSSEWAMVSTCGAANAKILQELQISQSAEIYVFPQNDEAGKRWLEAVIQELGRDVRVVVVPPQYKDLGEWGLNGCTPATLQQAIDTAPFHKPQTQTKANKADKDQAAEELAQRLEAEAKNVAQTIDAFYDVVRKEYPLRKDTAIYQSLSEGQFKRVLRFHQLSSEIIQKRYWSQTDIVIRDIQEKHYVSYVGPLAGRALGYFDENGTPFLVTSSPSFITPASGEWKTIDQLFKNLLWGDAEPCGKEQQTVFFGWLQISFKAVRAGKFQPGQALAFAGPIEAGKSLTQKLITLILGGRSAKAAPYLQGRTDFNSELFGPNI
jgi:hypothetical protein